VNKIGTTSITINLRVTAESWEKKNAKEVTNGIFVYVAIDNSGKSRKLPHK
jgi:acyl-CoA hydrolase